MEENFMFVQLQEFSAELATGKQGKSDRSQADFLQAAFKGACSPKGESAPQKEAQI
jgi:hypothetical protein